MCTLPWHFSSSFSSIKWNSSFFIIHSNISTLSTWRLWSWKLFNPCLLWMCTFTLLLLAVSLAFHFTLSDAASLFYVQFFLTHHWRDIKIHGLNREANYLIYWLGDFWSEKFEIYESLKVYWFSSFTVFKRISLKASIWIKGPHTIHQSWILDYG